MQNQQDLYAEIATLKRKLNTHSPFRDEETNRNGRYLPERSDNSDLHTTENYLRSSNSMKRMTSREQREEEPQPRREVYNDSAVFSVQRGYRPEPRDHSPKYPEDSKYREKPRGESANRNAQREEPWMRENRTREEIVRSYLPTNQEPSSISPGGNNNTQTEDPRDLNYLSFIKQSMEGSRLEQGPNNYSNPFSNDPRSPIRVDDADANDLRRSREMVKNDLEKYSQPF